MTTALSEKVKNLFQKIKAYLAERRRKQRYAVSWDAALRVRFPDFQKEIEVTVTDFSILGARLNSKRIYLDERRMIVSNPMPELYLRIFLPEGGTFESKITIHWYNWSVEKNVFEIGMEFKNLSEEKKMLIDSLIKKAALSPSAVAIGSR